MSNTSYKTEFWNMMRRGQNLAGQYREMADTTTGTYLLPEEADNRYNEALNKENLFRRLATVIQTPTLDSTVHAISATAVADWIPEGSAISEDNDGFSQYDFEAYKLASIVKLHVHFIEDKQFDIEKYLVRDFARRFGKAEENAFLNGDGNGRPTGILNSTNGADVGVTALSAAAVTLDEIVKLFHSVKPEYREKAVWAMSDTTALALRTLKDNGGNYLWPENSTNLLGRPVVISNNMPTIAAGNKPVAFGDFSYYWIVERMPLTVRPLFEKYILSQLKGYLGYERLDGKLIRPEAIKVLQMAV